jgi:hypothetical protein
MNYYTCYHFIYGYHDYSYVLRFCIKAKAKEIEKVILLWNESSYNFAVKYQCYEGSSCFHLQIYFES